MSRVLVSRVTPTVISARTIAIATCVCLWFSTGSVSAQLAANQTQGFGNGRLVTFTYLQNFDCVEQPTMDLDFNGKPAQSDPNELQTPICQVVTEPTADPTGGNLKQTAHLYVLVPMFSVDNDTNPADAMACPNGGMPVLIMDQSDWPAADGSRGITSSKAMDDAEAAGRAIEVGSNFFLFFTSGLSSRATASHGDNNAPADRVSGHVTPPLAASGSAAIADQRPAAEPDVAVRPGVKKP
jgi:hypothetical protein